MFEEDAAAISKYSQQLFQAMHRIYDAQVSNDLWDTLMPVSVQAFKNEQKNASMHTLILSLAHTHLFFILLLQLIR